MTAMCGANQGPSFVAEIPVALLPQQAWGSCRSLVQCDANIHDWTTLKTLNESNDSKAIGD